MSELSEYEQLRLSHIKRNQEYLKLLGIEDGTFAKLLGEDKPAAAKKRVVKKKKRDPVDESQCRRSSRVRGAKPDYTGLQYDHTFDADRREAMDTEDEDEDEEPQQPAHLRHIRTAGRSDAEKEAEYAAIVADSRAWLASSRQALCLGGGGRTGPSTTDEWKAEAVRRWGARVADVVCSDWKSYVTSRLSHPPPPSPLELMQEFYAHDSWQLLVCCVLMSRVSSSQTKHRVISNFFQQWPTPSAMLDADPAGLLDVMKPLGLFPNRLKSLIAVSERFLAMEIFEIGLDKEHKIYGIGEFGLSSYWLFCCYGMPAASKLAPKDKTLQRFLRWLQKQPAPVAGSTGISDEPPSGNRKHKMDSVDIDTKLSTEAHAADIDAPARKQAKTFKDFFQRKPT